MAPTVIAELAVQLKTDLRKQTKTLAEAPTLLEQLFDALLQW